MHEVWLAAIAPRTPQFGMKESSKKNKFMTFLCKGEKNKEPIYLIFASMNVSSHPFFVKFFNPTWRKEWHPIQKTTHMLFFKEMIESVQFYRQKLAYIIKNCQTAPWLGVFSIFFKAANIESFVAFAPGDRHIFPTSPQKTKKTTCSLLTDLDLFSGCFFWQILPWGTSPK